MNDFLHWNMARDRAWEPVAPLREADADELFRLFDEAGLPADAMNAEMADGYMTACHVGPMRVPVHLWLEAIFGQPTLPICADAQTQERLLTLLLQRYQAIAEALSVPLKEANADTVFVPLTAAIDENDRVRPRSLDTSGERQGRWQLKAWAEGFRRAMFDDPLWDELLDDAEAWPLIAPVILYQQGYNPEKPDWQLEEDEKLLPLLVSCLYDIRAFWREREELLAARAAATPPHRRETPKIGRNNPCPCHSGKKYKKCCGA